MAHMITDRFQIPLLLLLLLGLAGLTPRASAIGDPFRIEGKPPALGYLSLELDPIEPDLIELEMIKHLARIVGVIEPRAYTKLRRAIIRDPIDPGLLSDQSRLGYLHLHRAKNHIAYEVFAMNADTIALRRVDDPEKRWGIGKQAFDQLGVRWPTPNPSGSNQAAQTTDPLRLELPKPYYESPTVLSSRTVRARFKQHYPKLTRTPEHELYRVRLPKNYNPDFPAGVLVWISPMDDGRIPQLFEPILDELGFIAIGVDKNGNTRQLTDRLQNHLDSIETLGSQYRIDRQRVYLTGMSGGGRCSGILQLGFPDLFAGAVPIVGLDTYHNAPTGEPGRYWPARLGKPSGRWMKLLKSRRIAGITGTADFNEPEMSIRQGLLERDGIEMRLDIIEGMSHAMPDAKAFSKALKWVDEPRRDAMVSAFKEAKSRMSDYLEAYGDLSPPTPAARRKLIEIITLAPWTDPAWRAAGLLGYERSE